MGEPVWDGTGTIWECSVLSAHFFYKSNTALKIKVHSFLMVCMHHNICLTMFVWILMGEEVKYYL